MRKIINILILCTVFSLFGEELSRGIGHNNEEIIEKKDDTLVKDVITTTAEIYVKTSSKLYLADLLFRSPEIILVSTIAILSKVPVSHLAIKIIQYILSFK